MTFWGVVLKSGKPHYEVLEEPLRLTNAALELKDGEVLSRPATIWVKVESEGSAAVQTLLCTLSDHQTDRLMDLYFDVGDKITFSLKGMGSVHLSGISEEMEEESRQGSTDTESTESGDEQNKEKAKKERVSRVDNVFKGMKFKPESSGFGGNAESIFPPK